MSTPGHAPSDLVVDTVDWLPSGAHSGLIRVRGHSVSGLATELPQLLVESGGDSRRLPSLPDPRAGRADATWRGAYVLDVRPLPDDRLWLTWANGTRMELPAAGERPRPEGGEVVDRVVLADRRVRRAEASEQAQARIAEQALKAVEVLEARAQQLEAEVAGAQEVEASPSDPEVQHLREALSQTERASAAEIAALRGELEIVRAGDDAERRAHAAEREIQALRAELEQARHAGAVSMTDAERQRALIVADRRASRLRAALTATISTVAELRLRLHEADVARRSREVGHSADAVRLAVLDRELEDWSAELAGVRGELQEALDTRQTALDHLAAAQVALDELRAVHAEQAATLADSQERVAELAAELAAAREEAEARVSEAIGSARLVAEAAAAERADERIHAAEALTAEAERVAEELRIELDAAQAARELAEAKSLAADAERRAFGVERAAPAPTHASLSEQLDRARASLRAARAAAGDAADHWTPTLAAVPAAGTDAPVAPEGEDLDAELALYEDAAPTEGAASAAGVAPDADPTEDTARAGDDAIADLEPEPVARDRDDAATDADPVAAAFEPPSPLRRGPVAPLSDALLEAAEQQARAAERAQPTEESERVVANLDAAAAALRGGPTIVSGPDNLPNDLARERGGREYPALRGALVKLAHDDPAAAGRVIVGLLGGQHVAVGGAIDWDLTVNELGTFGVTSTAESTVVTPLEHPRGRPHAAFHTRGDALSLAEAVAGFGDRPRRLRGGLRTSGRVRDARRLTSVTENPPALPALVDAGAELDPVLIARVFTYTVRPGWTAGQAWSAELVVDGKPLTIVARPGGGLVASAGAGQQPDARIHVDQPGFRALVAGTEQPLRIDGDKATVGRLLALVERARALGGE